MLRFSVRIVSLSLPPMRRLIAVLALVLLLPFGYYVYANPERLTLNDQGRAEVAGQYVALSAGITHYELAGPDTGRVAVLVHGFSVPAYIWDSTSRALALAGHKVIRYDLFGRGWSDRPDGAYDGAFYDAQLNELLDSLQVAGPVDLERALLRWFCRGALRVDASGAGTYARVR